MIQDQAFAWNDTERGRFQEDFFPPIIIPTVEHKPWVLSRGMQATGGGGSGGVGGGGIW